MDILQEENGKYAAKTRSTASALSFSGAKIAKLPVIGGHWQFNPSLTSSMHTGYKKVKFMCSSLGKILPRPSDLKLRYVGGETRMVSLPRHINYEAFNRKMVELYGPDIVLKYQLPEEDLDALVSVLSDEDLENMMEECDRLSANEGSSKLRAFIFLASELDIQVLSEIANFKSSERKFVDAINAISDDALSVGNSTGKLYQTSDSFNDAYKAWNGITSQEKDSFFSKNPYSEGLPSEDYVSSGDFHKYESFVPDDLQNSASLFSHSAFMGQPVLSHGLGVPDVFNNDLVSGGWSDSPRFFGEGTGHSYGGSHWVTSLETSLPTQPANDDRKEDRVYEVEHSLGESRRGDHGNVWIAQDDLKYGRKPDNISRLDKASASDPALQNEYPTKSLESGDTSKLLVGQLQSDSFALSPGALLQKQLMGSPLNGAPLQKHFLSDWPSNELSTYVNKQPHFLMNAVEKQPEEVNDHVLQELWEKPPRYDSSFGLDQQNHVFSGIDDDSFGVQFATAAEVSPLMIENSAAFSPANTAPSSPSGWNPRLENNDQNVLLGDCSCIMSIASAPPQDSRALSVSLGQVSANFVTSAKPIVELAQVDGTRVPDQSLRRDPGNSYQIFVTKEPYTVFTSQRIDQEALMANRGQLTMPSNLVKGAVPLPIFSDDRVNKLNAIQIENQQSLGSSLPIETCVPSQLIATAAHQHKIDQLDSFSKLEEVSQPALVDESHRLDMISELLGSTRLTNYLAATSSTAESFKSRSERSVDEDLHCEEGEKLSAVVKEESLYTANESSDFPLPTFQTTQNSLSSNKQFDKVVLRAFPTNFDDVNSIFADASSLRVTDAVSSPPPSQAPAFTSVIESWEATLLQDEDERHKMEHFMQEHEQKQIDRVPAFDKEPEIEDSGVDFEEMEEFQLFDYGQINAAAIAEQEAISRGLQIIRNSDLEELHELGSGTFGTVYHGKWRGTDVAIKRIKASFFAGRQAERDRLVADFWREACILGQLHHPNVVAFYGAVPDGPGATLATVTEYMVNGSLKQVLQNKDRTFDRRKRLLIAMDAAFGMEYLHGKNVVHFDIKCENLLVNLKDTQRPICKVGDLGLSKVKQQTFVSGGVRGTLPWMAPELLNGSSSLVSEKVDVFSFGIVMWELLTGEEPYAHMHYGAIIGGIVNNTLRPTVPRWCDPAWRSLMEKCWAADPNERPNFLEIARTLRAMEASLAAKGPGQARVLEMYN